MAATKFNPVALKKAMKQAGVTQADLARRLRIKPQGITYYLNPANAGRLTLSKINRIARALKTDTNQLLK